MKLVLGTFARDGIEALWGSDLPGGVRRALRRYAARENSGVAGCLDRGWLQKLGDDGVDLELSLDSETEKALERKAREYSGVTVEELAAHAVLVYLADLDRAGSEVSSTPVRS
ncbi:MAG TPA: hypothetical protein VJ989_04085 [Solirubrobacterales bacterium]|nr:hypothetical protein [Solirubrobacterales bacterium]